MKMPGFCGGYEQSQSSTADAEDLVNFYPERLPAHAKNDTALYPTPGFQSFASVSNIVGRAALEINDMTFFVMGAGYYSLDANGNATLVGTVTQDSNPATLNYNGPSGGQILVTSGGNGYCHTISSGAFTQVLTGDALMGGMLDGYFIAFANNTIRISDLNDGTIWDPTQFASRSSSPDPWLAMVVVQQPQGIWLIGEQTGDVWYDASNFPFPFAPIPGASFRNGTAASFSVAVAGDSVVWLTHSADGGGQFVRARGFAPQVISTSAIDTVIATHMRETTIDDAETMVYQDQGHLFAVLALPSANATYCVDLTSGAWHRRGKWNSATMRYDIWAPRVHCHAWGKHLIADRTTGTISVMDISYGTELDGTAIVRLRIPPGIFSEHRQIPIRRIELYLEAGLGTLSGQGQYPTVMMSSSRDGGKTWGPERTSSAGVIGAYLTRVIFNRCAIARDRVYKFRVSDPIPWRIVDAYFNNDGPSRGAAS